MTNSLASSRFQLWRCRRFFHLPHAVFCIEEEWPRLYQKPTLQGKQNININKDCRHVHVQDRQARPRQSSFGWN